MQGNAAVIELLNEGLTAELTAINQYFVHAKMCANWGYSGLAAKFHTESIDEMKDAERLIDRILYLDGVPNMQRLFPVRVGETPIEQLRLALETEQGAIERYNRGVALCTNEGDNGTAELFRQILVAEESHADWLEAQLHLVDELGEQLYLASWIDRSAE